MIREYLTGDIDKLNGNQYALIDNIKPIVDNPELKKLVLEDNGIKAIVGFIEYHPKCYEGFFLLSNDIAIKDIKTLKILLKKLIIQYKPIRLQTTSEDCETINRWMKFMGFTLEGTRRKFMFNKDFKMWSIIWDLTL